MAWARPSRCYHLVDALPVQPAPQPGVVLQVAVAGHVAVGVGIFDDAAYLPQGVLKILLPVAAADVDLAGVDAQKA